MSVTPVSDTGSLIEPSCALLLILLPPNVPGEAAEPKCLGSCTRMEYLDGVLRQAGLLLLPFGEGTSGWSKTYNLSLNFPQILARVISIKRSDTSSTC